MLSRHNYLPNDNKNYTQQGIAASGGHTSPAEHSFYAAVSNALPLVAIQMTFKTFISFTGGLLQTALIYGLTIYAFVFGTFSFAGETLTEKENREALFFYTSLFVVIATVYIIYRRLKVNKKFSTAGITIPLLFGFYILFVTGKNYYNNLSYYQGFDHSKWIQSEWKPFKMAKTITKEKVLIGQTKQQVISKLGLTKDSLKNEKIDYLKYRTDNGSWELRIYFVKNKVSEAYLYEEGLML